MQMMSEKNESKQESNLKIMKRYAEGSCYPLTQKQ